MGLESVIKYTFNDKKLLDTALVHSSFTNENKGNTPSNERLEYLGDAVLELVISEYIYTTFPDMSEGEMTKLRASIVCEPSLAKCAKQMQLGYSMKMGRGEMVSGGAERDSILCDAFEAIIGALYLDGGQDAAKSFILGHLEADIHRQKKLSWASDCKTFLQEQLQKNSTAPIEYAVINEEGPDHSKIFTVELSHGGKALAQGIGRNKKEAEQKAAYEAILLLGFAKE